jgi:hypothetical protein
MAFSEALLEGQIVFVLRKLLDVLGIIPSRIGGLVFLLPRPDSTDLLGFGQPVEFGAMATLHDRRRVFTNHPNKLVLAVAP